MAAKLVIGLWLARASASDELGLRVEWHAPFVSGGGYCSEATAFAEALADANVSITAVPHGDGYSREYFDGLPAEAQARLRALLDGPGGDRATARLHCPRCYCFLCDGPAAECASWAEHSIARDDANWLAVRSALRAAPTPPRNARPRPEASAARRAPKRARLIPR